MHTGSRRPRSGVLWLTYGVLCLGVFLGLAPTPVLADGGGGGGDSPTSAPRMKADDPEYTAGVAAIKASDFSRAIRLLEAVVAREPSNADAFNWLAYATRRSGDPARSIPIYQKALAINPRHRGAHEYIGEAYLALNEPAKAKEHLARLDSLCFFPCSEYRDLKKAIQDYETNGGRVRPASK